MNEEGLTVQPQIIVVGPGVNTLEKIYVVVDEIKYEVESAMQAIDIRFRSFTRSIFDLVNTFGFLFKELLQIIYKVRLTQNRRY